MERCLVCQGELEPTSRLCRRCGRFQSGEHAPMPAHSVRCPTCGEDVPETARFCAHCGQNLFIALEEKGPRALFRERLIDWKTLKLPLKILLGLTLAQTLLVALLLVVQVFPQPQVNSGIVVEGSITYVVPLVVFVVLTISLATGYWFALAGALRVHWSVRFLVVALITGVLAFHPLTILFNNVGVAVGPFAIEIWLRRAQLGVLALFWLWAVGDSLVARYQKRQVAGKPWHWRTFVGVLAFLLVYYGLEFGVELAFVQAGLAQTGTSFLLDAIGLQVLALPDFFVLLFLWYSTDLLDWGQILARSTVFVKRQVRMPFSSLLILTLLVATGVLFNELRQVSVGLLLGLVVIATLGACVLLLVRFARVDMSWPAELSPMWLLYGASFLFITETLLYDVTYAIATSWGGLVPQVAEPLAALLKVPLVLITLTLALFLLSQGRAGKPRQGVVGFFLILLILLVLIRDIPAALSAGGFSVPQPGSLLGAIMICAALGTLYWIFRSLRQGSLEQNKLVLALALLMLAGLQAIDWAFDLLKLIAAAGSLSTVLLAVLFLLLALWSFVTSGEQVTNADTSQFPREGRILLSMGYTLVANALLLYLGTLRAPGTGASPPDYLSSDLTASAGLLLLGPPIVLLGFILQLGQRIPHRPETAASPQPVRQGARMQWGIVGSGALVTVLMLAFIAAGAFPQLVHRSAQLKMQPYTAAIPGPGCDNGAANWSVTTGGPISTQCLATGLQVTDEPHATGRVVFSLTPFPQNYTVSVDVNLRGFSGCAAIGTRFSAAGDYQSNICTDNSWFLSREGDQQALLTGGKAQAASSYRIEAVSDGSNQRLSINGVQVSTLVDSVFSGGFVTLEITNSSLLKKAVLFSNFVFTPLPVLTPVAQTSYRASAPGAACDKGGAQWGLQTPQSATMTCQPGDVQLKVQARQEGIVAFTPPGGSFPQNYQVSVQVDLRTKNGDCASIDEEYMSDGNFYENILCSDGSWVVTTLRDNKPTMLANGWVPLASTYTLQVTAFGPNLRLAINGIEVSSLAGMARTPAVFLSLAYTPGKQTAATVFRNFVFAQLPGVPSVSSQAIYRAMIPGAACDKGSAQWPLLAYQQASVQCQTNGMRLAVPGNNLAAVGFTPPAGIFPQNYRVTVQVNLASLSPGCVGIEVRTTSVGNFYEYALCTNGTWALILQHGSTADTLVSGKVVPTTQYTITAAVNGPNLSFILNGKALGAVSNPRLTNTTVIGLSLTNTSHSTEEVVLSNFVFAPLA